MITVFHDYLTSHTQSFISHRKAIFSCGLSYVKMKKIKYLYIPIGGIGARLKKDRPDLTYSSKCFLTFQGKSLLIRIIENCRDFCTEIIIVFCNETQYQDAYDLLGNSIFNMKVQYIKNIYNDPYLHMPTNGDCIAVMGDSYIPCNTWVHFFNRISEESVLSFLRFVPKNPNQDYACYKCSGDYITDWSHLNLEDYEYFEIGQLLYFPMELIPEALDICLHNDALYMLRHFINKTHKVRCLSLPCFNINNGEDYDLVSAQLVSAEGGCR